jgi:hypothetical protein
LTKAPFVGGRNIRQPEVLVCCLLYLLLPFGGVYSSIIMVLQASRFYIPDFSAIWLRPFYFCYRRLVCRLFLNNINRLYLLRLQSSLFRHSYPSPPDFFVSRTISYFLPSTFTTPKLFTCVIMDWNNRSFLLLLPLQPPLPHRSQRFY